MNDKKIIKDGNVVSGDLICYFRNENNSKKYCYYTVGGQPDGSPTVKVHVAVIKQGNDATNTPIADDEWANLKGVMGNVVQGKKSEGITYLIPANDLEVVNEKVIAMPVSYDYVNKHKAEYEASKVEDTESSGAGEAITPAADVSPQPLTPDAAMSSAIPDTTPSMPEAQAPDTPVTNLFEQTPTQVPDAPAANMFDQGSTPVTPPDMTVPTQTVAVTPEMPVTDIGGFSGMVPEPDKEIPKVTEDAPVSAPIANDDKTFGNILPSENDITNDAISDIQQPAEPSMPSNINIDEIKNKCTEMINKINEFSEELKKMVEELGGSSDASITNVSEPVLNSVEPIAVSPTPIGDSNAAGTIAPAADATQAGSFETNWFDSPQGN